MIYDVSIGIITGLVSGILSGIALYFYSALVNKFRNILDYAERTSEHYYNIIQYASNLTKENFSNFRLLANKDIHRGFWEEILDDSQVALKLRDSIAKCNEIIAKMDSYNDLEALQNYIDTSNEIPDTSLAIWNAITNYSGVKYKV